MAYRNLTSKQFELIKETATEHCKAKGLKTIGEYKRVANELIDQIESGKLTWADLLT